MTIASSKLKKKRNAFFIDSFSYYLFIFSLWKKRVFASLPANLREAMAGTVFFNPYVIAILCPSVSPSVCLLRPLTDTSFCLFWETILISLQYFSFWKNTWLISFVILSQYVFPRWESKNTQSAVFPLYVKTIDDTVLLIPHQLTIPLASFHLPVWDSFISFSFSLMIFYRFSPSPGSNGFLLIKKRDRMEGRKTKMKTLGSKLDKKQKKIIRKKSINKLMNKLMNKHLARLRWNHKTRNGFVKIWLARKELIIAYFHCIRRDEKNRINGRRKTTIRIGARFIFHQLSNFILSPLIFYFTYWWLVGWTPNGQFDA